MINWYSVLARFLLRCLLWPCYSPNLNQLSPVPLQLSSWGWYNIAMILEVVLKIAPLSSQVTTLFVLEVMDFEYVLYDICTSKFFLMFAFLILFLSHRQYCILVWRVANDFPIWVKCKGIYSYSSTVLRIHYKVV